jgi:hypothetical protein
MKEIRVDSWTELQEELYQDSWNPELGRYRSPYALRGLSDSTYKLETTLVRLGGDYVRLEQPILRNFKKYASKAVGMQDSEWHWLSIAKHHGLPTRLLDWTISPFVAMHFATAEPDKFDKDGVIYAVNVIKTHDLLPKKLLDALYEKWADIFTVDMLAELVKSLPILDEMSPTDFVVFFEPPSLDDRIVNQFSLFSLISNPETLMDDWLRKNEDTPGLWRQIIIPKELKWEIRDKLDQGNITERVLFPGLDGLCTWLSRHYHPKP